MSNDEIRNPKNNQCKKKKKKKNWKCKFINLRFKYFTSWKTNLPICQKCFFLSAKKNSTEINRKLYL